MPLAELNSMLIIHLHLDKDPWVKRMCPARRGLWQRNGPLGQHQVKLESNQKRVTNLVFGKSAIVDKKKVETPLQQSELKSLH